MPKILNRLSLLLLCIAGSLSAMADGPPRKRVKVHTRKQAPEDYYTVRKPLLAAQFKNAVRGKIWEAAARALQELIELEGQDGRDNYEILLHGIPRWNNINAKSRVSILKTLRDSERDVEKRAVISRAYDKELHKTFAAEDLEPLATILDHKLEKLESAWDCESDYQTFKGTSDLC